MKRRRSRTRVPEGVVRVHVVLEFSRGTPDDVASTVLVTTRWADAAAAARSGSAFSTRVVYSRTVRFRGADRRLVVGEAAVLRRLDRRGGAS